MAFESTPRFEGYTSSQGDPESTLVQRLPNTTRVLETVNGTGPDNSARDDNGKDFVSSSSFDLKNKEDDKFGTADADQSPVEQVALTVPTTDDPSLPANTFRVWSIGLVSLVLLTFVDTFYSYRKAPISISGITVQILAVPIGRFLARTLPKTIVHVPYTRWKFSLNPGPFSIKEHVLISTLAVQAGVAAGTPIVVAVRLYYKRKFAFPLAMSLIILTQMLGYGWAGLYRKLLVDSPMMWWPSNLVQVSLFRALNEKDKSAKGITRLQFFLVVATVAFCYYVIPGYLFPFLTTISLGCFMFPNSVVAQILTSGSQGLGIGAFSLDWATVTGFLGTPLATPMFAIANLGVGIVLSLYVVLPLLYWNNIFYARNFPIYSSHLYHQNGSIYDINTIIDKNFQFDIKSYKDYGLLYLAPLFSMKYAFSFATFSAAITHVALFWGKDTWLRSRAAYKQRVDDVHTRLMKVYPAAPQWWFMVVLAISIFGSLAISIIYHDKLQLPWWGVLFGCAFSCSMTLPLGILYATTNNGPGLNVIGEYIAGYIWPGQPVSNMCFKLYSTIGIGYATGFLSTLKLGHYMKIPPRAMFVTQIVGSIMCGIVNLSTTWWLIESIPGLCDTSMLPADSQWTCPKWTIYYDASVIWGLISPRRIFGPLGQYNNLNYFFIVGLFLPVPGWVAHKIYPKQKWIGLINVPTILIGLGILLPATSVNVVPWFCIGTFFNLYVFRYHKSWWSRYNYLLSAGLDMGTGILGLLIFVTLGQHSLDWWGTRGGDHCPLASCPTGKGIVKEGCPTFH